MSIKNAPAAQTETVNKIVSDARAAFPKGSYQIYKTISKDGILRLKFWAPNERARAALRASGAMALGTFDKSKSGYPMQAPRSLIIYVDETGTVCGPKGELFVPVKITPAAKPAKPVPAKVTAADKAKAREALKAAVDEAFRTGIFRVGTEKYYALATLAK